MISCISSRIRYFVLQRSWDLHLPICIHNRHLNLNSSKLSLSSPTLCSPQVLLILIKGKRQPQPFSCSGHIPKSPLWLLLLSHLTPSPLANPLIFQQYETISSYLHAIASFLSDRKMIVRPSFSLLGPFQELPRSLPASALDPCPSPFCTGIRGIFIKTCCMCKKYI